MVWMDPKIDWDENDYYNYYDLDRVENNTKVVADMLGVLINDITVDRDYKSLIFAEILNRVETNIELVSYWNLTQLDEMKTNWADGDSFNWRDAIRLEKNLKIIYDILVKNQANIVYSGEMLSGERVI